MPVATVAAANRGQFPPEPKKIVLSPTSQNEAVTWRFTTDKPADDWSKPDFDDSAWKQAPGGFGTRQTPGAVVRTEWNTSDIWLRREFSLADSKLDDVHLLLHHDEDAEVYLNGVLAASPKRFISDYDEFDLRSEAAKALHPGKNTLAVHCHQTTGGQYIDVGVFQYEN